MTQSSDKDFQQQRNHLLTLLPSVVHEVLADHDEPERLLNWLTCSDFVADAARARPDVWCELIQSGDLNRSYDEADYQQRLEPYLASVADEAGFNRAIRRYRQREMMRLSWRDAFAEEALPQVLFELSVLAETCIQAALDFHHQQLSQRWGQPIGKHSGQPQTMVIVGMGKLGARELNFSSDIDLIFAYPESGETDGAKPKSNEEFFIKLGQKVIFSLNESDQDGFVYRVDMRLRPDGGAGKLALNFSAIETYYEARGRDWERYAWIKGRVVAGDQEAGEQLLQVLRPFVYRRYLDYGAFESLREMKSMIETEVKRKQMENNVKLGPGGIREIEFIGQAFQLIRGGREKMLQQRPILNVLETLVSLKCFPEYVAKELHNAYVFLRQTENRIQAIGDQQTHDLPESLLNQQRLARMMGFERYQDFLVVLDGHRRKVHEHFDQLIAAPQVDQPSAGGWVALWKQQLTVEQDAALLTTYGFDEVDTVLALLDRLRQGVKARQDSGTNMERLDRLMPLLMGAVGQTECPVRALARIVPLIEAVLRRSAYLALLSENPMALSQLVRLCHASPWIAEYLVHYPVLLDELLDPRTLYAPLMLPDLEKQLMARLQVLDEDDLESQMEVLRHFKQSNTLKVAAADISEAIPLMVVSDYLTAIAESVLNGVYRTAWRHLVGKYGRPTCVVDGEVRYPGMTVVGYGKLGGIEMGYGSDLDLVFIHNSEGEKQQTDGKRQIDNAVFFTRFAQRIIHMLGTRTLGGVLYETDTRLRPSGASGLLVVSARAFEQYQMNDAWDWEHQAIVRGRSVAGDELPGKLFEAIRAAVLRRPRQRDEIKKAVRDMRERMRQELGVRDESLFQLKQDFGGIADIEFMVQYGVLAGASEHPQLTQFSDNIRLLADLAKTGLFTPDQAENLADIYRQYRSRGHQLALQQQPTVVPAQEFVEQRKYVQQLWQDILGS